MKTILETTQLEFEKSDFLIDLVQHDNGSLYVEITQIITDSKKERNSIKINPTVLTDIIKVLQNYQAKIPTKSTLIINHITDSDQQKIQERYLRGVSINDLAMQFDQTAELIEMILRNKGIEVLAYELPKSKFWRRRKPK
jgi:3-deoxy-D-arabino-heptulosonate 7-phosphate (DAHP) synthase